MTKNRAKSKFLLVALPEAEKRHYKSLAAREGLTLRQAITQAFQAWEAHLQADATRSKSVPSTGDTERADKVEHVAQHKPQAATRSKRRPEAGADPSRSTGGGQVPEHPRSGPWISRAAQLDWSKCPLVESAAAKEGNIWVLRGTEVPLASVLIAVDEGHPLLEITEAYEISMRFLLAVLQYLATPAKPRASGQ
jgi:hypothetical protein